MKSMARLIALLASLTNFVPFSGCLFAGNIEQLTAWQFLQALGGAGRANDRYLAGAD